MNRAKQREIAGEFSFHPARHYWPCVQISSPTCMELAKWWQPELIEQWIADLRKAGLEIAS